jgi:DNA-binding response OmpR family regulator
LLAGSGFTNQEAAFLPAFVKLRHQLVIVDGQAVVLTRQEYRLLAMLAQHSGEILSRAILLTHVFGYAPQTRTRTLDSHIRQLRKKLGREGPRIETVVGKGYRFLPLYNPGDQERPTLSNSR